MESSASLSSWNDGQEYPPGTPSQLQITQEKDYIVPSTTEPWSMPPVAEEYTALKPNPELPNSGTDRGCTLWERPPRFLPAVQAA